MNEIEFARTHPSRKLGSEIIHIKEARPLTHPEQRAFSNCARMTHLGPKWTR